MVTNFRLLRSTRLMVTFEEAIVCACFASAASAFRAFLWASFSARFWASRERVEVAAARASGVSILVSEIGLWLGWAGLGSRGLRSGF